MPFAEQKTIFTYNDLEYFESDNFRHEIINGAHFSSSSPPIAHQRIVRKLENHLSHYVEQHQLGEVFLSPTDVVFHDIDVSVPDLLFVSNENMHIVRKMNIQGAPDLIIEVLSPNSRLRDKALKYKQYAYYGVKEYWIVNPESKTIEIHDLVHLKLVQVVPHNQILNTPLFPELNLRLSSIFAH